jgi:WD domain, G-beta repeat
MAVEREPISLAEMSRDMPRSAGRNTVIEAIENLRQRSLVERGERGATFTLRSMVLEYMTDRLVASVAEEIERGQPVVLDEQPLIKAQAKDYVRQTQERLIGVPILQRLTDKHGETRTEQRLLALLDGWRAKPAAEHGFGPGNVVNLLRLLRGDLRGLDLSRLPIRHAWLQGVDAQDASLQGHNSLVWGVALSADGRLAASASLDGTARLWDVERGELVAILHSNSGALWGVALSGDGRLMACGCVDGTVRLWETGTGHLQATLQGHAGLVYAVAVSADGGLLASGGADGMVRLWEAASGHPVVTLQAHTGVVWGVALSPDGRMLASGGDDGLLRLWDARLGTCLRTLHADRHYQRVDITGLTGVTEAQRGSLLALGAIEGPV